MNGSFAVTLVPRRGPPLPAEAWLVPAEPLATSFRRLRQAGYCLEELDFFVLPASRSCTDPAGLFVLPWNPGRTAVPGAAPYASARPGTALYLPSDCTLSPGLLDTERSALFHHSVTVWRPLLGPVGFEETDRLRLTDFLEPPALQRETFVHAHPGLPSQERLISIQAAEGPGLAGLWRSARNRLGEPGTASLPPAPHENQESRSRRLRKQGGEAALQGLRRLAGAAPDRSAARRWMERLLRWSNHHLIDRQREQNLEIDRLLHLLQTNPDEALRYAIPVRSDLRGPVRPDPGARLPRREPSFRNRRTSPEESASSWAVDSRRHQALCAGYREAANRELRHGRHLTAAYVFAELLKDYRQAANVLRQGGYFREAAALYQSPLGQLLEAAACFREGGLLPEALEIYLAKGRFLEAAAIHRTLGDEPGALDCFRREVDRLVRTGQVTSASAILERDLGRPAEAIELLAQRWPGSPDAALCLREEFAVRGRIHDGEGARRRLAALSAAAAPEHAAALLDQFAELAASFPDRATRDHARTCAYSVASRSLRAPSPGSVRLQVLSRLQALAPEDLLLGRDTRRYAAQTASGAAGNTVTRSRRLEAQGSFALPPEASWQTFVPRGREGFYAAGVTRHRQIAVLRSDWDGHRSLCPLPRLPDIPPHLQLLTAWHTRPEIVSLPGLPSFPASFLPPTDSCPRGTRIENPPWTTLPGFLSLAFTPNGVAWVLQRQDTECVLLSFSRLGNLIATHSLGSAADWSLGEENGPPPAIPMLYHRDQLFLGLGCTLGRFYRDQLSTLRLEEPILELTASPPSSAARLAVRTTRTHAVFWGDDEWGVRQTIPGPSGIGLRLAIAPSGNVLAVSHDRMELLQVTRSSVSLLAHAPRTGDPATAVLLTNADHLAAVFTASRCQLVSI